jgi:ammonia channel protein AmtB
LKKEVRIDTTFEKRSVIESTFEKRGSPRMVQCMISETCGICWICGWVFAVMTTFFMLLNFAGIFRIDPMEEEVGLDISHHLGTAYDLEPAKQTDVKELMEVRTSRSHGSPHLLSWKG